MLKLRTNNVNPISSTKITAEEFTEFFFSGASFRELKEARRDFWKISRRAYDESEALIKEARNLPAGSTERAEKMKKANRISTLYGYGW